jgi:hypothetical protein
MPLSDYRRRAAARSLRSAFDMSLGDTKAKNDEDYELEPTESDNAKILICVIGDNLRYFCQSINSKFVLGSF